MGSREARIAAEEGTREIGQQDGKRASGPSGRRWPKKGSATETGGRRRCSGVAGGRRWSLAEKSKTEEGV